MSDTLGSARVFLAGGAGVPNYGDELIVDHWLRWYTEIAGVDPSHIVLSGSSDRVFLSLFGRRFDGIQASRTLRKARFENNPLDFGASVALGMDYLNSGGEDVGTLRSELEGTTVFHLHGGGYLNSKWPTHGFLLGVAVAAKELTGCRVIGTGLGLGPLDEPTSEQAIVLQQAFGAFDLLEVRDSWSYDYLTRYHLHPAPVMGLDDAFLWPAKTVPGEGSTLHLSLRDDDASGIIARWISQEFVDRFDRLCFWACVASDLRAYIEVAKRFPYVDLLTTPDLLLGVPASSQDLLVTQRFHPHLQGARTGMLGTYHSDSDYYDVKHQSVVDLGSRFLHDELDRLPDIHDMPVSHEMLARDSSRVDWKQELAATALGLPGYPEREGGAGVDRIPSPK